MGAKVRLSEDSYKSESICVHYRKSIYLPKYKSYHMKHHFADFLDRTGNYWTIIPNNERFIYSLDDEVTDKNSIKIITIGKNDRHWKLIFEFPNLEELTLHEPSKEQLEAISSLTQLKRLRITHARPKNIEFIESLENIEELVFEYVSGFSDLSPLNKLKKLRSLHLECLRRVHDFSGLAGIDTLKYLYINGTLDWNQPIANFTFLEGLPNLEVLKLIWITNKSDYPALIPILKLKHLKTIHIPDSAFTAKEYAFLEVALPGVDGAVYEPYSEYISGTYYFLGKGSGYVKCSSPFAEEKCDKFIQEYEIMKQQAISIIEKNL